MYIVVLSTAVLSDSTSTACWSSWAIDSITSPSLRPASTRIQSTRVEAAAVIAVRQARRPREHRPFSMNTMPLLALIFSHSSLKVAECSRLTARRRRTAALLDRTRGSSAAGSDAKMEGPVARAIVTTKAAIQRRARFSMSFPSLPKEAGSDRENWHGVKRSKRWGHAERLFGVAGAGPASATSYRLRVTS
jgi:hypothetical protein